MMHNYPQIPNIPQWELDCEFHPLEAEQVFTKREVLFCKWPLGTGGPIDSFRGAPSIEAVAQGRISASAAEAWVRDPDTFLAGEPHRHLRTWQRLTENYPQREMILRWIREGINVKEFITPFTGVYRGEKYKDTFPPNRYFRNNTKCKFHKEIISREIEGKIAMGAIRVWGKVGAVRPPAIVMPFSIEPSKPRLVHDQQYINCFMRQCPFSLDQVVNLPRYLSRESYHTKLDDKSGFDHFLISEDSQPYMGAEWGGWWLVWRTLPQGWRESPYIYQTLGLVATNTMRELGVPCCQYIDDRHIGELWGSKVKRSSSFEAASCAFYVAATILTELGYFVNIGKCVPIPTQQLVFLGHLVDTVRQTFSIPEDKKKKFIALREEILAHKRTTLNMLQRFQGKCISLTLMVPAAQLYTREVSSAISRCLKKGGGQVTLEGDLLGEVMHWRFVDTWSGCVPWRTEDHKVIKCIASDASQSRWGATFPMPSGLQEVGDYFGEDLIGEDIATKEAYGLVLALRSFSSYLLNTRVDAQVDNKVLYHAWYRGGCRNRGVNKALKEIFEITLRLDITLSLQWIPSAENSADQPSREWSDNDVTLSPRLWERVQIWAGPHTIDLMALDSNAKCDRHYTPFPMPHSTGVNFFAQDPCYDPSKRVENGYIFPPTYLMGPVLRHLKATGARATVIAPSMFPRPYWWPILREYASAQYLLAEKGDLTALIWPTRKHGLNQSRPLPMPWDLLAFRIDEQFSKT